MASSLNCSCQGSSTFGNPKTQIKACKSSVIPSQGKYFSHKRCRYRAAAASHKCSCNWDDAAVKYENMHTYMYLYCPYTIKNRIPKPGIRQMIYFWQFWMWTYWFLILQHARPCRNSFGNNFGVSKCAFKPLSQAGTRFWFFSISSVEVILLCRNTEVSIMMEKNVFLLPALEAKAIPVSQLLLLQWNRNYFL